MGTTSALNLFLTLQAAQITHISSEKQAPRAIFTSSEKRAAAVSYAGH